MSHCSHLSHWFSKSGAALLSSVIKLHIYDSELIVKVTVDMLTETPLRTRRYSRRRLAWGAHVDQMKADRRGPGQRRAAVCGRRFVRWWTCG